MEPLGFIKQDKQKSPGDTGCCPPQGGIKGLETAGSPCCPSLDHPGRSFLDGTVSTPRGEVPRVKTVLDAGDRLGSWKARLIDSFRMDYKVEPGLYAAGSPGPESEVLVSANYKLSFDHLRRSLAGTSAWILVLDTRGINVWCAAGKGTFGTEEIIRRVKEAGLGEIVEHRRLVLPQLGAPGVRAHEVKKATGFRVHYGPVRASDTKAYIDAGLDATPEMRKVRFGIMDRLVLTPMEVRPALGPFPLFAAVVLAAFGLRPEGLMFRDAFYSGGPFVALGFGAVFAGAFLTPLMLPWVPTRSFAVKGLLVGALVNWLMLGPLGIRELPLVVLSYLFFPAASSYIALQFTGSTTYTGMSGVKVELKFMLPVYIACLGGSVVLLAAYKIMTWGAA